MKRTTVILFSSVGLLGLCAGAVLGGLMAKELDSGMHFVRVTGTRGQISNFAARQFMFADDVRAREAVLLEIEILTKLEQADHDGMRQWDLGMGYARLAIIEGRGGQKEAERQALVQARYWYDRDHPHKDLTDLQIEDSVARMDKLLYKAPSE